MIQNIITFIIVAYAIIFTLLRIVRFFTSPLKGCDGCGQHGQICSLKVLKKEIEVKPTQNSKIKTSL